MTAGVRRVVSLLRGIHDELLGPLAIQFWASVVLIAIQALWATVVLSALAAFLQGMLDAGKVAAAGELPAVLRPIYDRLAAYSPEERALLGFACTGAAVVAGSLLSTLVSLFTTRFSTRFICQLRAAVFEALLANPMAYHDEQRKGALLQLLVTEVRGCYSAVRVVLFFIVEAFEVAVYLAILATLSLGLTLAVGALGLLFVGQNYWTTRRIKRMSDIALVERERLMATAEERLGAVKLIKLLGLHEASSARLRAANDASEHANLRVANLTQWQQTTTLAASFVCLAGLSLVALREGLLSLAALAVFFYVLASLASAFKGVNQRVNLFATSLPSAERVLAFVRDAARRREADGGAKRDALFQRQIELRDVRLSYGDRAALHGIDLVIERGRTVALVGHSGSGKTSIANLLPRLYPPTSGAIELDGAPIESFDLSWLRSRIGLVNQDSFILNLSIADNIRLARPTATHADVLRAATLANADEFVSQLPSGYDTVVGDRGVKLSGGQRQRLHIAQVFLKDPELLILDEATSALDTESEQSIQRALEQLAAGRTTLVIAHRLSTVRAADLIAVLDGGRVVERGRWAELVSAGGPFARMVAAQDFAGPPPPPPTREA